ncbi:MAG: helix-turn-helix transcriptional regulator [Chloroflexi bacterium]|nr:helix-turn-helix transcriptional regulator [Chloroflexota bacterium]
MSLESVPRYARATIAAPDVADKSSALTRREREIAHLLVAGYTNRQLAETLVISEQTVETHVKRILGKLELHSRYQLASVEIPA